MFSVKLVVLFFYAAVVKFSISFEDSFANAVKNVVKGNHDESDCDHLPDALLIITACNSWQFDMLLLQREGLKLLPAVQSQQPFPLAENRKFRPTNCLLKRLITVCLDDDCMEDCSGHDIKGCVRFLVRNANDKTRMDSNETGHYLASVKPSPFESNDYNYVTYLKWEMIERAILSGAKTIFVFDVDVLILRDPFRLNQIMDLMKSNKLLHQVERGEGCSAVVNTGVMIIKNSLLNVVVEMLNRKQEILSGRRLEQDIFQKVLDHPKSNATRCSLPGSLFTGHCRHPNPDGVFVTNVVTYHANRNDNQYHKVVLLLHFLNKVVAARSSSQFLRRNITFRQGELSTILEKHNPFRRSKCALT